MGSDAAFLVDDEKQSDIDTRRLYYDWVKVRELDQLAQPPQFVFNSGQWFGTSGVLTRDDFSPWVEWTMPRRLRYPQHFMPGDQGILNYVINQKAAVTGLRVERRKILHWPGHGMHGIDVAAVRSGLSVPLVVHWAGMKKARQRDMVGADLLAFFENEYYKKLSAGAVRKVLAIGSDSLSRALNRVTVNAKLAARRLTALRLSDAACP